MPEEIQMPKVKCDINNCTHWIPGSRCGAASIDILNEEVGKMSQKAEQTKCKTFSERRGLSNLIGSADNMNWVGFAEEFVGAGRKLNPKITCVVDTCKYWQDNNLCNAETIEISEKSDVSEYQATNCNTFEYNEKPSNNEKIQQQQRDKGEQFH